MFHASAAAGANWPCVPQLAPSARLALTMRSLGWVGLKSRRLAPGGFRDTTIRGWARPFHEKNYAPPTLQFAFGVDGSENDDVTYTLLTRLTFMDVAGYRSEWRTDFQFGNTYGAATELYRPFAAMAW